MWTGEKWVLWTGLMVGAGLRYLGYLRAGRLVDTWIERWWDAGPRSWWW